MYFFLITTYFLAVLCLDYFYSGKITFRSAFISSGAIKMSSSIIKTSAKPNRHAQWNGLQGRQVSGLMTSGTRQLPTLGKFENTLSALPKLK